MLLIYPVTFIYSHRLNLFLAIYIIWDILKLFTDFNGPLLDSYYFVRPIVLDFTIQTFFFFNRKWCVSIILRNWRITKNVRLKTGNSQIVCSRLFHRFYHQKTMSGIFGDQAHEVENRTHISPYRVDTAFMEIIVADKRVRKKVIHPTLFSWADSTPKVTS